VGSAVRPGLFHTATPAASVKNRSCCLPFHRLPSQLHIADWSCGLLAAADAHGLSHWKAERALSVALVGLLPAAFLAPGPMVDYGLAVLVPLHNYMCVTPTVPLSSVPCACELFLGPDHRCHPARGMDVVFTDYVAKSLLGPAKALNAGVHIATVHTHTQRQPVVVSSSNPRHHAPPWCRSPALSTLTSTTSASARASESCGRCSAAAPHSTGVAGPAPATAAHRW
jgi:hypothetical protein